MSHSKSGAGEGPKRPKALLIAGPTASGKSALALRLASRFGGRIINADAMQVYRDLRIVTARPSALDTAAMPHRLYGTVDGEQTYSVSRWLADVQRELADCQADGARPIIVGGTGLYFKALVEGLSDIPAVPDNVRTDLRAWASKRTPGELHAELAGRDPVAAGRLRPTDPQRILRAIEVHAATGESLASFQSRRAPPVLSSNVYVAVALIVDRATLRERVDRRLDGMVEAGALDEIGALATRKLNAALPVMRAIGVPQFIRHLAGEIDLAGALNQAKIATRQYIKRQETFARHQLSDFRPLPIDEAEAVLAEACQS